MNWIIGTLLVLFSAASGSLDLARPPDRHDRPIGTGFALLVLAAIRRWSG